MGKMYMLVDKERLMRQGIKEKGKGSGPIIRNIGDKRIICVWK
jgi:hypothetical protein